jgi:hypothetical protein
MRIGDSVKTSVVPEGPCTGTGDTYNSATHNVFTSTQSVVAFPLAVSVVATISRASHTIGRTAFDSVAVPLAAAFIVGGLVVALTMMDPLARPSGVRGWAQAISVAFLNSLVLFAAALGIEKF